MANVIVIINSGDIPAAVQIAQGLASYTVWLFDPVLVDQVTASGLHNVELIPWDSCTLYDQLDAEARAATLALEAELDLEVRNIVPEVSIISWQYLNLYYVIMALKWYSGLWNALGNRFYGTKVHVLICDSPSTYYFNSFTPAALLLAYLKSHDIEFSGYSYGSAADVSSLIPDLSGINAGGEMEQILTHLPTCFYDSNYFNQEICSTGKTIINIAAKHFNIPVSAHKTLPLTDGNNVLSDLPDFQHDRISAFTQKVKEVLERCFSTFIAVSTYRDRQVQHLSNLYRFQLITYFQLNSYFEQSKPSKIVLSDHDAGFHGPIVSFAHKHYLPIVLLPHSKNSHDIQFAYNKISVLTHPAQGRALYNFYGKSMFNQHLLYPELLASSTLASAGIKTVSLLLNSQSLNGIYFSNWKNYIEGIRQIVAWSQNNNITLNVRCSPSYSILLLLSKETGLDISTMKQNMTESMDQHAARCELCLMYDQPTSGALNFLRNSIPILNPQIRPLAPSEIDLSNPVIPRESIDLTLHRVSGFLSDQISLTAFRNAQFRNYVQLFQNARPLRSYL